MEAKLKHLEFIQATIQRLASHSFAYKGWAVTTVGAIVAFVQSQGQSNLVVLAICPAIIFGLLDAFYLRQERIFRKMYDSVSQKADTDFSMNPEPYRAEVPSTLALTFSASVGLLYIPLIGFVILAWLLDR